VHEPLQWRHLRSLSSLFRITNALANTLDNTWSSSLPITITITITIVRCTTESQLTQTQTQTQTQMHVVHCRYVVFDTFDQVEHTLQQQLRSPIRRGSRVQEGDLFACVAVLQQRLVSFTASSSLTDTALAAAVAALSALSLNGLALAATHSSQSQSQSQSREEIAADAAVGVGAAAVGVVGGVVGSIAAVVSGTFGSKPKHNNNNNKNNSSSINNNSSSGGEVPYPLRLLLWVSEANVFRLECLWECLCGCLRCVARSHLLQLRLFAVEAFASLLQHTLKHTHNNNNNNNSTNAARTVTAVGVNQFDLEDMFVPQHQQQQQQQQHKQLSQRMLLMPLSHLALGPINTREHTLTSLHNTLEVSHCCTCCCCYCCCCR